VRLSAGGGRFGLELCRHRAGHGGEEAHRIAGRHAGGRGRRGGSRQAGHRPDRASDHRQHHPRRPAVRRLQGFHQPARIRRCRQGTDGAGAGRDNAGAREHQGRQQDQLFRRFPDDQQDRSGQDHAGHAQGSVVSEAADDIVLRAEAITKAFPGTVALDAVDFEVHARAVNVLIGENGAGKSTLMKILAGVEQPTMGRLVMWGEPVSFASIRDAASHGIGIVFQELNLCPNLSVTENIFLGRDLTKAGFHIDRAAQRKRAGELLARLEHGIDPDSLVGELMIGEQQIVEIAKALAEDARVLIMDEPTSALSASEVEVLFKVIEELKRSGVAIIYISHRLEELVRIGDYFTVLRDGRLEATATRADVTIPWIIKQMLGADDLVKRRPPKGPPGAAVLALEGVSMVRANGTRAIDDVSVAFRAGEITAIYGLLGAGRTELFESLYGLRRGVTGSIKLAGRELGRLPVTRRMQLGLVLVPEDRQRDGLVQNLTVGGNLGLSSLKRFTRLFSISRAAERPLLEGIMATLHIKAPGPDTPITS